MSRLNPRPPLWRLLLRPLRGLDPWLMLAVALLLGLSAVIMHSAGLGYDGRMADHLRNMGLAVAVMFIVAQVPPQQLQRLAVPAYAVGVALLVAVLAFGITRKGATRWLNVGVVIQPSEMMKIAMPLMLAWWFQRREGQLKALDFGLATLLLALPTALIMKQPDLGTSLLVLAAGLYVIFFAGLSWWLILPILTAGALGIGALILTGDIICQPGIEWPLLHEYQRHRVCTLLDPMSDPLGKGFHIIQGMIAIGSGGLAGKGYLQGTQAHLDFVPEHTTDFIFAAYAEEFGLLGSLGLLGAFAFLILRGLAIAHQAPTVFTRLLAGALSLSFFTYVFVNIGMVSGILPVVGVPLPFVSYGGTAMVTLGIAVGMLLAIARSRRMIQS
ncbi:MAG: rod shape-determining protein RodA [Proteobacteria bacterium]|nr:rod shape-determining protein RodA [Pseudomonadota bacterium]